MLTDLKHRLRSLFRRSLVDQELDEELRFHFEQAVSAHEARGLSREEAMRRARLEFGSFAHATEEHRDARGLAFLEDLGTDLRYAVRQVRRSPGFALLAFACLGLGIGINTAVFSAISAVLLRPLAVAEPDRLVSVTRDNGAAWPYSVFEEARGSIHGLEGLAASLPMESDFDVGGNSEFVAAEAVSSNYGEVLRPTLWMGRWFTDDREASAVISEASWERRFNRDPDVLGRLIRSQSESYTVVGIARADFTGVFAPIRTDLWVPIRSRPSLAPLLAEPRRIDPLMLFGRLRPDSTIAHVGAELRAIDQRLPPRLARDSSDLAPLVVETVRGVPHADYRRQLRTVTTLLAAVVGVVLMIACVNVGNLLLARGAARQREFVVRRALGASRTRLRRQLFTEGLVLAAGGCACGVLIAVGTTRILSASLPSMFLAFATALDLALDWRALAFAVMASMTAGIVSNVVPARVTSRLRGLQMLRGEAVISQRRRPLGAIAQVALSLVLLLVVGSFIQRLLQLQTTTLGFSVDGRIYAYTFVPSDSTTPEAREAFYRRVLDRLQTLPGVRDATLTSALPLMPADSECISDPALAGQVSVSAAGPRYFDTLGISLVAGGDFGTAIVSPPQGVIVNETLARRLWPGTSAVGQRVTIGCKSRRTELVLGVARDSVVGAVGENTRPHLYRPFTSADTERLVSIVVSAAGDANAIIEPVRRSLIDLGGGVRVYAVGPLGRYVEQSYGQVQWMTRLLAAFGLLALILAVIGLYGVIAYRVTLRTREIGVRMALGANRADVFREVLGEGFGVVLIGLASGEVLAVTILGLVGSMQEGIRQPSTVAHGIAAILWIGAALLACYAPAARAAGVDPLNALRHE